MELAKCRGYLYDTVYVKVLNICFFGGTICIALNTCHYNSYDLVAADKEQVSADIEGGEKLSTRVTYNIVFVSSEAAPYSKTGGLGDVCGSLPIALAERGHRVMVVTPRYQHGGPSDKRYASATDTECRAKVFCSGGVQEVAFYHEYRSGVDWVHF